MYYTRLFLFASVSYFSSSFLEVLFEVVHFHLGPSEYDFYYVLFAGGQVLVHCKSATGESLKSGHLVLDYVTDAVLHYSDLSGEPYVSPDGRFMVIVDDAGDTITVHRVQDDGRGGLHHCLEPSIT